MVWLALFGSIAVLGVVGLAIRWAVLALAWPYWRSRAGSGARRLSGQRDAFAAGFAAGWSLLECYKLAARDRPAQGQRVIERAVRACHLAVHPDGARPVSLGAAFVWIGCLLALVPCLLEIVAMAAKARVRRIAS